MRRIIVGLIMASIVLAGCAGAPATPSSVTKIRLPMGYIANVQYAPFYVAVDKGYFAEEGIEIEFDYRFETDGMKLVGAGELPFAVASGEQVPLAREQGLPVVYVMQWFQKFPIAVVAPSSKGIRTPADLIGKQVGLPGYFGASYVGWRGLLNAAGIGESDVKTQDIGFTQVAALQQGAVDAAVGYVNNEPIQLEAAGIDVDVIPVSDYVSMVANGVVTNEKTIAENPGLVRGFVRALLRGLQDVIADPDAAFAISTRFVEGLGANPDSDEIQREVLAKSIDQWRGEPLGRSSAAAWDTTQDVLISMGLLEQKLDGAQLFTNRFVDEVSR